MMTYLTLVIVLFHLFQTTDTGHATMTVVTGLTTIVVVMCDGGGGSRVKVLWWSGLFTKLGNTFKLIIIDAQVVHCLHWILFEADDVSGGDGGSSPSLTLILQVGMNLFVESVSNNVLNKGSRLQMPVVKVVHAADVGLSSQSLVVAEEEATEGWELQTDFSSDVLDEALSHSDSCVVVEIGQFTVDRQDTFFLVLELILRPDLNTIQSYSEKLTKEAVPILTFDTQAKLQDLPLSHISKAVDEKRASDILQEVGKKQDLLIIENTSIDFILGLVGGGAHCFYCEHGYLREVVGRTRLFLAPFVGGGGREIFVGRRGRLDPTMPRNYFGELEEALETTGATVLHLYYRGEKATYIDGIASYKGKRFGSLSALGKEWAKACGITWNTTLCYCDVEIEDDRCTKRRKWDTYLTTMDVDDTDMEEDEDDGKDWSGFIKTFVEHDPTSMKKVVKTIKKVDPRHKFSKDELELLATGFEKMSTEDK